MLPYQKQQGFVSHFVCETSGGWLHSVRPDHWIRQGQAPRAERVGRASRPSLVFQALTGETPIPLFGNTPKFLKRDHGRGPAFVAIGVYKAAKSPPEIFVT